MISNFGVMFFDDPARPSRAWPPSCAPAAGWPSCAGRTIPRTRSSPSRCAHSPPIRQLPSPAPDDLFADPQSIADLLVGADWQDIRITPITERAWIGSDVDDVMGYVRGMPVIRDLTARLKDPALAERVLAEIADEYAARQSVDGSRSAPLPGSRAHRT